MCDTQNQAAEQVLVAVVSTLGSWTLLLVFVFFQSHNEKSGLIADFSEIVQALAPAGAMKICVIDSAGVNYGEGETHKADARTAHNSHLRAGLRLLA
jgi:hypothetical protein